MKRRIFNVLFALVLALSLGLVTAVPAGAQATLNVFPLVLDIKTGDSTAEWSTTQVKNGSYSAYLDTGTTTQGDEARIEITMPSGTTLNDIISISWWVYAASGYPPHLDITLDCDGDSVVDDEDMLTAEMNLNCVGAPVSIATLTSSISYNTGWLQTFELTSGDGFGAITDSTKFWVTKMGSGDLNAPSGTLAQWKAGTVASDPDSEMTTPVITGSAPVKKLEIEVDKWVVNSDAHVDDVAINGVVWYGLIQDAIDSATNAGDTINVAAGTYTEDLKIDNKTGITLRSENGKDVTTITTTAKPGIEIQGSATGFTLGGASGQGFTIDGTAGHLIVLSNNPSGVTISYNEIDTTGIASRGISVGVAGATSLTVSNNTFTADSGDGSLSAWDGPTVDVTVSGNEFEGGSYAVQFSGVTSTSGDSTISGNNITGYTGAGAIVITNGTGTSDLTISGNEVIDCTHGVRFEEECNYGTPGAMTAVTVNGNTITDSSYTGIKIGYGTGLNITGNNISGCPKGVQFAPDTDAEMENNTFADNTYDVYHAAEIMTGGSSFYGNIQDAIEAADPGETILVYAGTYTESLDIDKSLTVQSEEGAITGGGEWEPVTELDGFVEIELGWDGEDPLAETAVFDGFYIEEQEVPIYLYEVNNGSSLTISNNVLEWFGAGIYGEGDTTDNASSVTIEGNYIFKGSVGIYFETVVGGSELIIRDNVIARHEDEGIYIDNLAEASTVTIEDNLVAENYYGIAFYDVYESTVTIAGNTIGEGYCEEWNDYLSGNYYAGIYFGGEYTVSESTITIGGDSREEGNVIIGNGSGESPGGIHVYELEASSLEILNNDILDNNYYGVWIGWFDEYSTVDIHLNSIANNYGYGVSYDSPYLIDATCNWWGDIAGPTIYTNPCSWTEGDSITSDVAYIPWLIQSELAKDWNIWSRPIAPGENSWEQMQAELVEDGVKAFYFYYFDVESSTQVWGNDPDEAGLLDAFYIKMPAESRIRYCISDEATFPGVKEMAVGWNFIGLTELYGMGLDDALYDAYWGTGQTDLWGYSKVISPFLNEYSWLYQRGLDEPWTMYPTEGYWVFMVNDGTLGGFTLTPVVEVENGP